MYAFYSRHKVINAIIYNYYYNRKCMHTYVTCKHIIHGVLLIPPLLYCMAKHFYPPSILCMNGLKKVHTDLDNLPNSLTRTNYNFQNKLWCHGLARIHPICMRQMQLLTVYQAISNIDTELLFQCNICIKCTVILLHTSLFIQLTFLPVMQVI